MILTGKLELVAIESDGFLRYSSLRGADPTILVQVELKKFGIIPPQELTFQIAEPVKSLKPNVP